MSFSCTWGFCLLRFCLFLWKYLVVEKLCFCLTNWILKLFYQKISFQIISWVLICSEVDGSCSLYFHCSIVVVSFHCLGKRRLSCSKLKLRGKKNERFNIISILFYWSSSYQSLIFVFINFICRKGLVDIFDKLEAGQLKEGSSLSYLVTQMHKNR